MSEDAALTHAPARLTALAESLPANVPFVGPEALQRRSGKVFKARIGANESVFGPSPRAVDAMTKAAAEVWKYGDPEVHDLRAAIAAHHGVRPENVAVGEGVDGLLGNLVRLLVAEGDPVVSSLGGYPTFAYHVRGFGGVLHGAPYRDDAADPEALARLAAETGAGLVYLANPDNPMGGWRPGAEALALAETLAPGAVLCLDEAYADFAPEAALAEVDIDDPRVIRMRTFSKAYGLAGLRVGYALGEARLIAAFDRVRNHFGMGRIAQAGALAALEDRDWLALVVREVAQSRARIGEIAAENGLVALPSATNFVAVDCGGDGAFARAVLEGLVARGVFVRMPGVAPLDRCIRVTAGRASDLAYFAEALPAALAAARKD